MKICIYGDMYLWKHVRGMQDQWKMQKRQSRQSGHGERSERQKTKRTRRRSDVVRRDAVTQRGRINNGGKVRYKQKIERHIVILS